MLTTIEGIDRNGHNEAEMDVYDDYDAARSRL